MFVGLSAAVACPALLGCADERSREKAKPSAELARARQFKDFRLYYVGDSFRGFGLAKIYESPSSAPNKTVTFWYGDCEQLVGGEGACGYDVTISVSDICERHFKRYGVSKSRLTTVRGVPAGDFGNGLELYTGDATVVIPRQRTAAREVAAGLRSLDGRVSPPEDLPPPVSGALSGRPAGCRTVT